MRSLFQFAFPLVASFLLSGCILDRMCEMHRQLYAKEPQVLIEDAPGGGLRFRFLKPTLLENDVDWLVGQAPTSATARGEERFTEYVLVQEGRGGARPSPLTGRLRYVRTNGEYRLAEIDLPKMARLVLSPAMISAAIKMLRHPAPDLLRRRLRLDLKSFRDIALPSRSEVEQVIGPGDQADGGEAVYRFQILLPDNLPPTAGRAIDLKLLYDASGRIRQAEGRYLRYHVRVDMDTAEAVLNVK